MRTSNPVFRSLQRSEAYVGTETASYRGIVTKTAGLLLAAVLSGYLALVYIPISSLYPLLITSMIVAFVSVMVASFSPRMAMPFGILYALSEGVLLGVITMLINTIYPGVALAAVLGTVSIFTVMLFLYSSRTIRVTPRFRKVMYGIMMAILLFMVIYGILYLFGGASNPIFSNVPIALLVTGIMIVVGALMLAIDFDNAEAIVSGGADKTYEWIVAVGLMVTIVWIYIELLRFLAILASRRN